MCQCHVKVNHVQKNQCQNFSNIYVFNMTQEWNFFMFKKNWSLDGFDELQMIQMTFKYCPPMLKWVDWMLYPQLAQVAVIELLQSERRKNMFLTNNMPSLLMIS